MCKHPTEAPFKGVHPLCTSQIEDEKVRNFRKILAAYQHALKPRLLVLVGLAALSWVGTHSVAVSPEGIEQPLLDPLHQVGAFLQ